MLARRDGEHDGRVNAVPDGTGPLPARRSKSNKADAIGIGCYTARTSP